MKVIRLPRKMEIWHKGHRYWATLERVGQHFRPVLTFWSDHDWPFYHATYEPDVLDPVDCWQKFEEFIPGYLP